jgi:hypothetical protein
VRFSLLADAKVGSDPPPKANIAHRFSFPFFAGRIGAFNIFTQNAKQAHHCVGALATVHTSDEGVAVSAFATQPIASLTA